MADKKKIIVRDAVEVFKVLRYINASKIPTANKTDLFAIIRATRAFKGVADAQADFEKDVVERLKPENFDTLIAKRNVFDTLPPEEQREVAEALTAFDKAFTECVEPEQKKEVEIDAFEPLSESAIASIAAASDNLTMETLLLVEEVCCK